MLKRSLMFCGLILMVSLVSSCFLDPDEVDPVDPPPPVGREDLSQRWHVLNNIEYSYVKRRADVYDELLDEQFVFFFSLGDVNDGQPEQWGRTDELAANTALFESNSVPTPTGPVCRSIRFDLIFDPNNIQWVERIPENAPDEIWYTTTLNYNFTFEMEPDQTFIPGSGLKGEFTVRDVGPDGSPRWQLVEFRELDR